MKFKKVSIFWGLLFISWLVFIFYMSSQTAVNSGHMSQAVTKDVLVTGEKLGVLAKGTAESAGSVGRYDGIIRSLAHMGMYFLLACIILVSIRLAGLKGKKWTAIGFAICFLVSISDELNQMRYAGRNDNGLITSGIADLYKDAFGITAALLVFWLVKVIYNGKKLTSRK